MKKFIIIILIFLTGCIWTQKQVDYAKLCQADPACLDSAKKDAELAKLIFGIAYPVASGGAGALILAMSLWIRGRKKEKING